MRRWNGWTDEGVVETLSDDAARLLEIELGPGNPSPDASFEGVVAAVPSSRLPEHELVSTDAADRVLHARGQSLPDWIALRAGRLGAVPDGVAHPAADEDVRTLLGFAARSGARVVPFGGGTSVVGGVTTPAGDRPVLVVAMDRLADLRRLDETSGLASFGAGVTGPAVEAALASHGRTLGHFPQSFERSTLGGWVAARSAGQQSLGFGRIEALFAGGHLESPAGGLDLPTHPASAAGPDLRELVLGSEGRLGVVTEAVVRTIPRPAREAFPAWFMPDWPSGLEAARELAQARLPLSMVRLSTPLETATLLALAGSSRSRAAGVLRGYLRARRVGVERSLLLIGASGSERVVEAAIHEAGSIIRRHRGAAVGGAIGRQWLRTRYRSANLRDTLWDAGYAVDTLETATDWTRLPDLAAEIGPTLRRGLEAADERVHAFSHVSHVYPSGSSLYTTFVFRLAADPDETLARWRQLKAAASRAIVAHGGTISHQHGIGRDHAPYLAAEKGDLGMAVLADVARRFDPDGLMNRGVLLEDG